MMKKTLFFALFITLAPATLLAESTQTPEKPSHYTVKNGDCLWNISKDIWGDPQKWPMLYVANQAKIHNPNLIYAGQRFTIPVNFTAEDMKKATRIANEKAQPIGAVAVVNREEAGNSSHVSTVSRESSSTEKASSAAPEKAANPPTGSQETQAPASNTTSGDNTSTIALIIVALIALVGGLFLWMRTRKENPASQEPRPLSSFPQTSEPPVSRPTVVPSTPSSSPVSTLSPSPSQANSTPKTSPLREFAPPVTTPVTPSPVTPSTPPTPSEPVVSDAPQTQLPLTPSSAPSEPEAQAGEGQKPSDTPPPPASTNHAA